MAGDEERYTMSRARMDRSLDEIAAEMHSTQVHRSSFGEDYENRPFGGAESYRELDRSSRRYAPYSGSGSSAPRREGSAERGRERVGGQAMTSRRVFVANLNYETTWQRLKDHMRKCIY